MRVIIAVLASLAAYGQQFEVASIRPAPIDRPPSAIRGGPGTADSTHLYVDGITIRGVIAQAYGVRSDQVEGPSFLGTEHFDVAASVPSGASRDALVPMWRDLITDRFRVEAHVIQREFPSYDLLMASRGHRLTPNSEALPEIASPLRVIFDDSGRPGLPEPGLSAVAHVNRKGLPETVMVGRAQPVSALAVALSARLGRLVVDKTGLPGRYDFALLFNPAYLQSPRDNRGALDPGVTLEDAVQQLGLRLVSSKTMLDVVIVDRVQMTPTEN